MPFRRIPHRPRPPGWLRGSGSIRAFPIDALDSVGTRHLHAQSIVAATVSQAAMNTAMTVSPDGLSRTITFPCADGGSMSMTFTSTTGAVLSGTFTSSSRIEFTECRTQTVTINGDPAILMDGAYTFGTATGECARRA